MSERGIEINWSEYAKKLERDLLNLPSVEKKQNQTEPPKRTKTKQNKTIPPSPPEKKQQPETRPAKGFTETPKTTRR
jgi:hypothetical protein